MKKSQRTNTYTHQQGNPKPSLLVRQKWPLIAAAGVVAVALLVFGLNYFKVINLTNRQAATSTPEPTPSPADEVPPPSKIDYSPATPTDNEDINKKKEDAVPPSSDPKPTPAPTPPSPAGNFTISVIQADQNNKPGSPFQVRTILSGLTGGTCELRLTHAGQADIVKTANTIQQPTYMTCAGFDVPYSDFHANGSWHMTLTVTDTKGAKKAAEQTVQISGGS